MDRFKIGENVLYENGYDAFVAEIISVKRRVFSKNTYLIKYTHDNGQERQTSTSADYLWKIYKLS